MKNRFGLLCALLPVAAAMNCSDGPQLVFPREDQIARITGYVEPRQCGARVYLEDVEVIDSTVIDSTTGKFTFDSVRYGDYRLRVKAAGYGVYDHRFTLKVRYFSAFAIYLQNKPSQFDEVDPPPDAAIDDFYIGVYKNHFTDSTAVIDLYFNEPMDSASVARAFTATPAMHCSFSPWSIIWSSTYYTQVSIPLDEFFAHSQISFTIDTTARTLYGEPLDFTYTFSYYPDTSSISITRIRQFIGSVTPSDSTVLMNTTDPVRVTFTTSMNRASVEQRLSIAPPAFFTVWWDSTSSGPRMTVTPSDPLRANAAYLVTIDSGYQTADGSSAAGFSTNIKTRPVALTSSTPMNGQVSVSRTDIFTVRFNTLIDGATVLGHVSIVPAVDSLAVAYPGSIVPASSISFTHAPLLADTLYTVTLDSALTDAYGVVMGRNATFTFRTGR